MKVCSISSIAFFSTYWDDHMSFCLFAFNLFILNWEIIALQYFLVSAIHQYESTIGIHMSPPWRPSHLPLTPSHPHTYEHLIFYKEWNGIQCRKDSLFNKWCWDNCTATCKRMKLEHFLTPLVQFSSVAQSCPTLCDPMNRSTPGLPVHHQLPEFTQTHVHQVSDDIQPSHPLLSPSPPAPNPSQHQSLFQWVNSCTGVSALASFLPKKSQGWSPSEWTGWISLQSKGLSRVFSNTTVQKHQWFFTTSATWEALSSYKTGLMLFTFQGLL